MNFGQSFRLALKSLMTSKMRAILTMLGIIIGVAAVIVIVGLGNGLEAMWPTALRTWGPTPSPYLSSPAEPPGLWR